MLCLDNTNYCHGYLKDNKILFYKIQTLITSILSNCLNTAVSLLMPLWNHKLVLQRCSVCYKFNLRWYVTTHFILSEALRCNIVAFLSSQATWTKLLNTCLVPQNDHNTIAYRIYSSGYLEKLYLFDSS